MTAFNLQLKLWSQVRTNHFCFRPRWWRPVRLWGTNWARSRASGLQLSMDSSWLTRIPREESGWSLGAPWSTISSGKMWVDLSPFSPLAVFWRREVQLVGLVSSSEARNLPLPSRYLELALMRRGGCRTQQNSEHISINVSDTPFHHHHHHLDVI